jgi:hypothetical protein
LRAGTSWPDTVKGTSGVSFVAAGPLLGESVESARAALDAPTTI